MAFLKNFSSIRYCPVSEHDFDYRQGMFKDPFGHYWQIQQKIQMEK